MSVTPTPEHWQTHWVIALYVAAGFSAAWFARELSLRVRRERERTRFDDWLYERERIARELHDTLLQGAQGLVLNLQVVAGEMGSNDPCRQRLEELLDEADGVIAHARDRVHELRDLRAEVTDLVASLSALGADLARNNPAHFEMHADPMLPVLAPDVGTEAFFIAREALSNAFRHARAKHIEVEVRYIAHALRLVVRDDGRGIDPQVLAYGGHAGHRGLHGMVERAKRIRARLDLHSSVDGGTEILLELRARPRLARRASGLWHRARIRMLDLFDH